MTIYIYLTIMRTHILTNIPCVVLRKCLVEEKLGIFGESLMVR